MITYNKGLPSLPDDIICEIFSHLDMDAFKSCTLTCKALSCLAKPFVHQTLYLTPRPGDPTGSRIPGLRNELNGLSALSERNLLQHTRHLSMSLPRNPLFAHDLQPHTQQFRAIANLRSLETRWLDTPSFIPKMEEYFGTFLGSLQSLEMDSPRGDHKQILYFVCQFPNLRDLKINGLQDYSHAMRNGGPHFDIRTSPPLNGTLDLRPSTNQGSTWPHLMDGRFAWSDSRDPQHILGNLVTLPSGLKFRVLKLSGCNNLQLLVDACAPTLERMEFTERFGALVLHGGECRLSSFVHVIQLSDAPQHPQLSFEQHPAFRKLEIKLTEGTNIGRAPRWLSETLSTITSNVFTELTISIPIALVSFVLQTGGENHLREWCLVDNVLDRLCLREDVMLVVRLQRWMVGDRFQELIERCFPLMWENGRVMLEVPPPP